FLAVWQGIEPPLRDLSPSAGALIRGARSGSRTVSIGRGIARMSSSLEMNKIAAAILVGGMLTLGIGIVSNAIYHPGHGEQAGGEGGAAEAPAAPAAIEPISKLLASADPAKGEAVAKKCQTCHDFTKGGPNKVGPNLWGVIGRPAGSHDGFAYSDGVKALGKPWTYEMINHFIAGPKNYVAGTKMSFPGLPKV